MEINFSSKCEILGKLSVDKNYIGRIPDKIQDWVLINDFILTLAWCISMGYAEANDKSISLIDEAYNEYLLEGK